MRQRAFARLLTVLCALHICAAAAFAQFDSATVLGFISDQTGAAMPGVTVTLTNPATGISTTAVSDERGQYQFLNVRIGTYSLKAELQGFTTAIAENFTVAVNARQRVDLALSVGGVGETVQVTGAARLLESESSDRGTVISREQIVNLPLNGRAYADLALLSPGVRKSSISTSRDASFNVNGLRSALNNFILDGVDNNSYGTSNQGFSNQVVQVSPDAVEEFKVQTNNFSAEFGRAGGAVINATFRSGTNQFRGAAWEFNRNTKLNATGFFKPSSGRKPEMNRNQFGGVFGGPIVRDRAFFFFNYEGFREVSKQLTFASLPTMEQRQGNLGMPVRNALTGELYANGVVPQAAITDFARKVLAGLPEPTRAGNSNNFDSLPRREDFNDKFDVKFDQKLGAVDDLVLPLQPSQGEQLRAEPDPGRDELAGQQLRRGHEPAVCGRPHTRVVGQLVVRGARRRVAHRRRQVGARHGRPEHARGVWHHRPADRHVLLRRPDAAVGERLDGVGPTEQQPAVPEPAGRRHPRQLLGHQGGAHAQDRLRVPAHQHGRGRRPPEIRR